MEQGIPDRAKNERYNFLTILENHVDNMRINNRAVMYTKNLIPLFLQILFIFSNYTHKLDLQEFKRMLFPFKINAFEESRFFSGHVKNYRGMIIERCDEI